MIETRQRLLDATRRCVRHRGLARTTSRDITSEANANLAAITYHFGSKDDLMAEALLEELREWLAPALADLESADDPAAGMLAAVQTLTTTYEHHREAAPGYLEALLQAPRHPGLGAGVRALWADLRQRLASQIGELRAAGTVGPWVDPEAMAGLLVAVANGVVLQATVDPDGPAVSELAGQFAGLLLDSRR
jgi:AcrR family transcriptional regulator